MNLDWSNGIIYVTGGTHKYPKHEGVYVIAKKVNGKKRARYVGQGIIADRMKEHESDNEKNPCLKKEMTDRDNIVVYYAKVPKQTERENAELTIFELYGGLEKLCNDVRPTGEFDPTIKGPFLQEISFD